MGRKPKENGQGLIKPTDLIGMSQEDAEKLIRAAFAGDREWTDTDRRGDLRVGAALVSMRISYGLPRSTIASLTGVSLTTITRIELGVRSLTAHSLSRLLTGLRDGIALLWPGRKAEFDRWIMDFLYLAAAVSEDDRLRQMDQRRANLAGGASAGGDE